MDKFEYVNHDCRVDEQTQQYGTHIPLRDQILGEGLT